MNMNKINGFTRPIHLYQIISYVYFLALLLVYFLIIFPLSSSTAKVIGPILIVINAGFVLISGYKATSTDPSDSLIHEAHKAKEQNIEIPQATEYFCEVDNSYVQESSKHCKRCGRCTEGFDHHCKWINNDVGSKNYKSFFTLICSVMIFFLLFLLFGALVTKNYAKEHLFNDQKIFIYHHITSEVMAGLVIMWLVMGITLLFLVLESNLVFFHIFLIKKGLTTFQYITLVEERKENKREMEIARRILGSKENKTRFDFILCLKGKKRKPRQQEQQQKQTSATKTEEEMEIALQVRQEHVQSRKKTTEITENKVLSEGTGTKENDDSFEIGSMPKIEKEVGRQGEEDIKEVDGSNKMKASIKKQIKKDNFFEKRGDEKYITNDAPLVIFSKERTRDVIDFDNDQMKTQVQSIGTLGSLDGESDREEPTKRAFLHKSEVKVPARIENKSSYNEKPPKNNYFDKRRSSSQIPVAFAYEEGEDIKKPEIISQQKPSQHWRSKSITYLMQRRKAAEADAQQKNMRVKVIEKARGNSVLQTAELKETDSDITKNKTINLNDLERGQDAEDSSEDRKVEEISRNSSPDSDNKVLESADSQSDEDPKELEIQTIA